MSMMKLPGLGCCLSIIDSQCYYYYSYSPLVVVVLLAVRYHIYDLTLRGGSGLRPMTDWTNALSLLCAYVSMCWPCTCSGVFCPHIHGCVVGASVGDGAGSAGGGRWCSGMPRERERVLVFPGWLLLLLLSPTAAAAAAAA